MLKKQNLSIKAPSAREKVVLLDKMHEHHIIDSQTRNVLLREIQQNDVDPVLFLLRSNLASSKQVEAFFYAHLNIASVALDTFTIDPKVLGIGKVEDIVNHLMLPFKIEKNVLCVAMDQPYLTEKVRLAEQLFKGVWAIQPFLCKNMTISEAIDCQFTQANKVEPLITQLCSYSFTENQPIVSPDQIIIKLVEGLLLEALEERASDIHFDSNPYFVRQRVRIDGVLIEKRKFNLDIWNSVKIRLKVLSDIDITESHLPQDGSFFIRLRNKDYDFRFSSLPSIQGESIVLRLNSHKNIVQLEDLGFNEELNFALRNTIRQPSGLILIGGPTSSGKTTTLYALLQTLDLDSINVATLEDPVEHIMPTIRQTNIHPELGLDFAQGIRALLRQDPDILLIGEIRDKESAELAIKASLTGHLVLATLHAAHIKNIPNRMLNLLDTNAAALYSQTLAIMAQRLLRKQCVTCRGEGCEKCNQSGYHGRFAIMEYLIFDEQKNLKNFHQYHYPTLMELATESVNRQMTDRKEVERVMGDSLN